MNSLDTQAYYEEMTVLLAVLMASGSVGCAAAVPAFRHLQFVHPSIFSLLIIDYASSPSCEDKKKGGMLCLLFLLLIPAVRLTGAGLLSVELHSIRRCCTSSLLLLYF